MHKLSKGLKKKIKGKKDKEKEDAFDQAELERYRREAREAAEAAAAAAENNPKNSEGDDSEATGQEIAAATDKQESEEWLRFKLLTSGTAFYLLFISNMH